MTHLDAGAPSRSEPASRRRLIPPLVWRRLPWFAELATIIVGYVIYTRSRVEAPAREQVAFFHSKQVWDLERLLHIDVERVLNQLVSAWGYLADATGYYYGTLHFIVTPLVLVWLWKRRPAAYPRLRSALIFTTATALAVYWTWPLAPPRFAQGGMVDILVDRNILNAANPHGVSNMVNLYAAMPSLHVAWASWCAVAVYLTTRGRWRKLVWLYPVATTFVVLGTANHYLLDGVGAVAALSLGMFLTRPLARRTRPVPPVGSIATTLPARANASDTIDLDASVLDQASDDGTIDVRRAAAPRPPTDR